MPATDRHILRARVVIHNKNYHFCSGKNNFLPFVMIN
jgi:hypothetical protein